MTNRREPDPVTPTIEQGSLFEDVYIGGWPKLPRFPTNSDWPNVGGIVNDDLLNARSPLLIAGYASLDRLVVLLSECHRRLATDPRAYDSIRLLLGNEPVLTGREQFRSRTHMLQQEVVDYWLERGISVSLSGEVMSALALLRDHRVSVRSAGDQPIHAKIYSGDAGVTIGSSNFTSSGLRYQIEANVRFSPSDGQRWNEARGLAEEIWSEGVDFSDGLRLLLEQLLKHVTWREALARACAEVLEGSWADRLRDSIGFDVGHELWPSQEQGIAHALWILEQQGSVLVADATGSGKTLLGSHLIRRVAARLLRTGRGRNESAVLMAPPAVLPEWEKHATECGAVVRGYSQGHLSHRGSDIGDRLRTALRRTQVLAIDEAHNFLRRSRRTTALFSNVADHVLLFTATPVNRGPRDMLAMIDLLGADNLDDETLSVLNRLWKRRTNQRDNVSISEMDRLRQAIRRFTVRRTKLDLNRLVDGDPERYRLPGGRVCRYPEHRARTYTCNEPETDLELAQRIRALAGRLRGLTRLLSPLELSEGLRIEGLTESSYVAGRVRGAAALAAHDVAASLRSSRVRLLEHLCGTTSVLVERPELARTRIAVKPGVIQTLEDIAGHIPVCKVKVEIPQWLRDRTAHEEACRAEISIYREIEGLARGMSDTRERAKADLLRKLSQQHNLVLAFDSHLITLADLRHRLETSAERPNREVIVATGETPGARKRLYARFRPGSGAREIIALCSDALAEGVNLQEASVVVMLDMPSVIRVAEQRIGRVDRMNSPHDVIEALWPLDPLAFAIRASERLLERNRFVSDHLGANLRLPLEFNDSGEDTAIDYEKYLKEIDRVARDQSASDQLQDAFASVRLLVEGDRAIVPPQIYETLRNSRARVVSSVSVVYSEEAFAFVAIAGTEWGAPRWVYLATQDGQLITDLDDICAALRRHLTPETSEHDFDAVAGTEMKRVLEHLKAHEEALLPRAKQRALTQMRAVLAAYRKQSTNDKRRSAIVDELLQLASGRRDGQSVDRAALADWWLRTIQPVKFRHLASRVRRRPVLLKDLKADLLRDPLETKVLEEAFGAHLLARPLDERVVAAIIGIA